MSLNYILNCFLLKHKNFYNKYRNKMSFEFKPKNPDLDEIEEKNNEDVSDPGVIIGLQLGDIIRIEDPPNEILNNKTFFIDYIDLTKIKLINVESLLKTELKIQPDKKIGDGTITSIILLKRNKDAGYAKQNGLLPNTWITIYFGGDVPSVITCKITNLEEDMIELKLYPGGDTIYINFKFQGLPEDLPIQSIEIREKPSEAVSYELEMKENIPELEGEREMMKTKNIILEAPIKNVKAQLKEVILNADQIKFGDEDVGVIIQYVDVNAKSHRYSIDSQVSDLLDVMLAKYPIVQRTRSVLNSIHLTIERFKQLREIYSSFDEFNNITGPIVYGANYKPLENYFEHFDKKLFWILPVVKNMKKIYFVPNDKITMTDDTVDNEIIENLIETDEIIQKYRSRDLAVEENKYASLYKELNPYFTPFDDIDIEKANNLLNIKQIKENTNTIVNNLDNFNSSVFNNNKIKQKQFITQEYNLGLNRLIASNFSGNKMLSTVVPLTNPDLLFISSFITLPEPTIRFSRINLPSSSILERANLNHTFINYWKLLKKNTKIHNININSLSKEIEYDEYNFVNNIKNYVLNLDLDELKNDEELKKMTKDQIYQKFINTIIPKTIVLFNLIKKYIIGKLSIVDVVGYLEPFNIYSNNLTYLQYREITDFIDGKISEFNKKFISRSTYFSKLNLVSLEPKKRKEKNTVFSIIDTLHEKDNIRMDVFDAYDMYNDQVSESISNAEMLRKLSIKDNKKLYSIAISIQNIPLMFPSDFSDLFDDEKSKLDKKMNYEAETKNCNNIVISKLYKNEDELFRDNDINIYFDKNYDTTNYGILDDYESEMFSMPPDNFIVFLGDKIKKKYKLSDDEAEYLTNTLINGHKQVNNGQYAIIYINDAANYYIRRDNKWVLDESVDRTAASDSPDLICNLQEKCISVNNQAMKDNSCESMELNKFELQNNLLKNIINEFDKKYSMSKEDFDKKITSQMSYNIKLLPILINIENEKMLKYNNQKYKLSHTTEEGIVNIVSPYLNLRDIILAQEDFVKKQSDTIRFVNKFTRKSYFPFIGPLGELESEHWLYCITTNTPLLPKFKFDIATIFFNQQVNFQDEIDMLIVKLGSKQSDDGDYWVDENSGWQIQKIDFSVEEGYEAGFKISTRSVIEKDAGSRIITAASEPLKPVSLEVVMINNIINSISFEMSINIDTQKDFIINTVTEILRSTLPNEFDYKRQVKEKLATGKTMPTYEFVQHSLILNYTIGMILIAIQTNIPSIKTRKTFPNCKKSFIGYPFDGTGDLSSLDYISCVVFNMKSKSIPWYTLARLKQEDISKKVKGFIDAYLVDLPEVKRKMDEKTEYLLVNQDFEVSTVHDIKNWTQFLPPLLPFSIKNLNDVSSDFKRQLKQDLVNGLPDQRDKILEIQSKIIMFSLAIQEKIQNIINKKTLLLTKANNEAYLENSCCNEKKNQTTIQYFEEADGDIREYNKTVQRLSNLMIDIVNYSKATLMFSNINTRNIYPPLPQNFDDKTIFLTFIHFCHFKSLIPIDDKLLPLCVEKPDISDKDSSDEIITKLKLAGKNYSNESFLRLLQLVSQQNIIHVDISLQIVSSIDKLLLNLDTIDPIDPENYAEGKKTFKQLIKSALDTFSLASESVTQETKDLNNFLIKGISSMKTDIIDFITKNRTATTTKKVLSNITVTIENISNWDSIKSNRNEDTKISNDSLYNIIQFFKTFIQNMVKVFPNIILNKVDYSDISVPKHWDLSGRHKNDVKDSVSKHYEKFRVFYEDSSLFSILREIQELCQNIIVLSNITPAFSTIKYKGKEVKPVFDERTSKFLFEYYILKVLTNYIDLAESDVTTVRKATVNVSTDETDLVTSEYLDELSTGLDFESGSRDIHNISLLKGNKKELKQKVSNLLVVFIQAIEDNRDKTDYSYEKIMDLTFKIREREKNNITSRLQGLNDEEREADTILKINKLGLWSKGLQKGLTTYVKDNFDEEREDMEKMMQYEKKLAKHNSSTGQNIDMDEFMEDAFVDDEIDRENLDMSGFTGDDGNYEEEEYDNGIDFDS
jgi:hypothetical protein